MRDKIPPVRAGQSLGVAIVRICATRQFQRVRIVVTVPFSREIPPATGRKTMNAIWIFEGGHLVARNESGQLLRRWSADEAMGQGLALMLSHNNVLSCLLLWPLCTSDLKESETISASSPCRDSTLPPIRTT